MWNHNTHFHNHILRQIPRQINHALDIGCGLGFFASKLANRAEHVDAIDVDQEILKGASIRHGLPNISYQQTDFLDANLPKDSYDVIVSIASIHHMDLEAALREMRTLLRPSGQLLILGLYREVNLVDYAYSAISVPLNFIYLSWHRKSMLVPQKIAPTRPAQLSIEQIREIADNVIPGFRFRRHLFWRYSLIWKK